MLRMMCTGLIICVSTLLITACQSGNGSQTIQANFDSDIVDTALTELVGSNSVVGVSALIYSGDDEVYYGGFGQADREADRPWQRDTLVTIYSMTKPITGVTLMSLYEEGLFNLDDPLEKYLPEYADV